MKKVISLLVACATASSLGMASFAADDTPGTATYTASANSRISSAAGDTVNISQGELFLVDRENNRITGVYDKLDPDTEYNFEIRWARDSALNRIDPATPTSIDSGVQLTEAHLDGGDIRLRTVSGSSSIQSARVKQIGRGDSATFELIIVTRATYGTNLNEVEYSLDVTGSGQSEGTFKQSNHFFEVGWEAIDDADTNIGEGGYITIANDRPVITKDQFTDIAKSVNYKTVNFEGEDGGWLFTGRVSGMSDSNFHYTYDVLPDIVNKFPDQEYKFLTFNAGVTFPASGEMRIDVSDISDDFGGEMYTYLYRNGKLTAIDSTYDSGANEIVFRTNYLGAFVITDKAITDTTIVAGTNDEDTTDTDDTANNTDNNATNGATNDVTGGIGSGNPSTGAASSMNVIAMAGLAALASAGMIARRRK